ncbi:MAG TPA: hypothetical protein VMI31_04265 [Fimbriimonadaceae bacterium]|nr:hypothetical protein [Fimbriimonadaceae bacterium]
MAAVVILKYTTQPTNAGGGSLMVESIGRSRFGMGGFAVGLDDSPHTYAPGEPFVRHEARSVAEEATATTTFARVQYFMQVKDQATMGCRAGASAKFGGETYTIEAVEPGGDAPPYIGQPESLKAKRWTIKVRSTHTGTRRVTFNQMPLDAAGQPIIEVDGNGNPMTPEMRQKRDEERRKQLEDWRKNAQNGAAPFPYQPQIPSIGPGRTERDGTMTTILFVDPAKIGKFQLRGQTAKVIEITGIPLDPK